MNEDFVPFELAKKLEEKGFDEECFAHYDDLGNLLLDKDYWKLDSHILAPTISQVLKWLREEKKIFVEIVITPMGLYKPMIYDIGGFKKPYRDISPRINFNEAAIAGIEYVIDNLI